MHSAKSSNGRIVWIIDKGQLTEISPSSPKFTMSATDTLILFGLLASEASDIAVYAEAEVTSVPVKKPRKAPEWAYETDDLRKIGRGIEVE